MMERIQIILLRSILGALALATATCSAQTDLPSTPPDGLSVAWFHEDCAPWDGPATSIYLGQKPAKDILDPEFPFAHVAVYSSFHSLPVGKRLHFNTTNNTGHARFCTATESCMNASSVSIEFSRIAEDWIEGRIEILFVGHSPIRGSFRASRMPFQPLCG